MIGPIWGSGIPRMEVAYYASVFLRPFAVFSSQVVLQVADLQQVSKIGLVTEMLLICMLHCQRPIVSVQVV